jgi:hypothetical protein
MLNYPSKIKLYANDGNRHVKQFPIKAVMQAKKGYLPIVPAKANRFLYVEFH